MREGTHGSMPLRKGEVHGDREDFDSVELGDFVVMGGQSGVVGHVRIGMGATPMLYYAEASQDDVDGGIEITGSHNPANYNGFKMVFQGRPFFGADIQQLGAMAAAGDWAEGTGSASSFDIIDRYVARIAEAALRLRRIGFDRVANTCAACHVASYRTQPEETPTLVVAGPNHTLDLEAFFRFLVDCARDPRFNADTLMAEIALSADLDLIDRLAYRYLIIPITKKTLIEREGQFQWLYRHDFPEWGRGRDDAMNLTKYFMIRWPMDDSFGPTDMPSVWNLKKYDPERGHRMNFAGDSHDPYSVIIDSALGLMGAEPKNQRDFLAHIDWLVDYLKNLPAPAYPFPVDSALAAQGKPLFDANCAACHASARTGTVVPLDEIGTDRGRIDTWGERAAVEANKVVKDMGIERAGLVEAPLTGYVAQFLDGIWLRAPYLHNGSVPTLYDLLKHYDLQS